MKYGGLIGYDMNALAKIHGRSNNHFPYILCKIMIMKNVKKWPFITLMSNTSKNTHILEISLQWNDII